MPFGIGIGQALGLVREVRGLEGAGARISVSGEGAAELAAALRAGGDASAVSTGGDPLGAAAVILLVEGAPSAAERATLRRLARAGTPLIVLRRGAASVPYVLPEDLLDAGPDVPVAELAAAVARAAGDAGPALAARLPAIRAAVAGRLIRTTSLGNAVLAATPMPEVAQLPVLSLAQSRMLLLLGLTRGKVLPRDPRELGLAAAPAVVGALGLGLASRALVRRLPFGGPAVRAAVAYAGTRAIGTALQTL